ncbi:MAG: TIGR03936 family radical SAM-associated protein [Acidimicrobiales bacterium]
MTRPNPSRLRLRYSKHGKIRFTSHRDMARVWERTLRMTLVPVAYSEGFNPRPKLAFGLALPTGFESEGEYLDIDISPDVVLAVDTDQAHHMERAGQAVTGKILDIDQVRLRIDEASPTGISVDALVEIDRKELSLQQAITSCTWRFRIDTDEIALRKAVASALAADTLLLERERKGKTMTDDIRPQIMALDVDDDAQLFAELGTQPRALRPAELLRAIEMPSDTARVLRTHQWINNELGGPAREPLVAGMSATVTLEMGTV